MLFGQHFDGELPPNLNHVFLKQFQNCCNKKIGTFMFKNQNDGATLSSVHKVSHGSCEEKFGGVFMIYNTDTAYQEYSSFLAVAQGVRSIG